MKTKKIKIISKFNCQSYPLDNTAIEVSIEDLEQIGITKCFDIENNCIIDYNPLIDDEVIKNNYKKELQEIKAWFNSNDWKVNKIVIGEWETTDQRWLDYLSERAIKRARQDELIDLLK